MDTTMTALEQRTHDWLMARCGCATGSRFKDVVARLKPKKGETIGAPAAARENYLIDVVSERLTGEPRQHFVNAAMQWGTDQEPIARDAYKARSGLQVDEVGFLRHATLAAGCSPDGIVELGEGVLEIKCPTTSTHVATLLHGMSEDHLPQVQGALWITGAQWCDFVSFDPRLPRGLDLHVQRIARDEQYIANLEAEVRLFLGEVDSLVSQLKEIAK